MFGKSPDELLWCRGRSQPLRPPTTTHWFGAAVERGQAADKKFLASPPVSPAYGSSWVQAYADPKFEALASQLERLLDQRVDDSQAVRATYRRAMHLELAFFDAIQPP